ncbi:hypothetical protein SDC9_83627 [bioreactor metagenome]|uniref:Uncharacterized protein n=1 Tax=bioreactor metagenome TaxID=1076179 RepID=A0A644Z893_9ZZZZ
MVRIGDKSFIHEYAAPQFSGVFLQGQRDQVAEAAFRQSVLIGKEAIITGKRQLPGTITGMAYQHLTELTGLTGRNILGKKEPGMRAVA